MTVLKGFVDKEVSTVKRMVLSIEGREGKGKSTLALSAPDPIVLFDFDYGLEGVIDSFLEAGKKILVPETSFKYHDVTDPDEWVVLWERYKTDFLRALDCDKIRTIVVDTGTEAWELIRLARHGKLTQIMPHHYGPMNAEFRDLFRKVYDSDKNFVVTHKLKAKYVNDKRTDEYEMAGFGDTPYTVQVAVRVWRKHPEDGGDFGLTIQKCRPNAGLEGSDLVEPMSTFQFLASTVFEGSDLEDWE